jgi:hypothetical protein
MVGWHLPHHISYEEENNEKPPKNRSPAEVRARGRELGRRPALDLGVDADRL